MCVLLILNQICGSVPLKEGKPTRHNNNMKLSKIKWLDVIIEREKLDIQLIVIDVRCGRPKYSYHH